MGADTSIGDLRITRELDTQILHRGQPAMIVRDNGTELTARVALDWTNRAAFGWHDIAPGKPVQNAFVESAIGKFSDECLKEEFFFTFAEAVIERWRRDDNHVRPTSTHGGLTPQVVCQRSGGDRRRNPTQLRRSAATIGIAERQ